MTADDLTQTLLESPLERAKIEATVTLLLERLEPLLAGASHGPLLDPYLEYSFTEAAERMGVTESTIRAMVDQGKLAVTPVGRYRKILEGSIQRYYDGHTKHKGGNKTTSPRSYVPAAMSEDISPEIRALLNPPVTVPKRARAKAVQHAERK